MKRKFLLLILLISALRFVQAQTVVDVIVNSPVHNTLEAAVYGKPVIFGPNFQKFEEAKQLLESGGAFTISNSRELKTIFDDLLNNNKKLEQVGEICQNVVKSNAGATMIITNWLQNHLH